jgi:hypothetical protein
VTNIDELMLRKTANEQNLPWNKWKDFLYKWAQALRGYETPLIFVEGVTFKPVDLEFGGKKYAFLTKEGGLHYLRRELMKKRSAFAQKKEKVDDYGLRLNPEECFLCKDIIRVLDEKEDSKTGNVIDELSDYLILANKYPESLGHSMLVPLNHDDTNARVQPSNGGEVLMPEKGKTKGAVITQEYLDTVIQACNKHNLAALRYHVGDDVSITEHDHFHFFPEDNPMFSQVSNLLKDRTGNLGRGIFQLKNTPFDTLAITSDTRENFSKYASQVLENMERDNQVFLIFYHDSTLLISPRKNLQENRKLHLKGADTHIHLIRPVGSQNINNIINHVAMKGEYNWKKYL